MIEYPVILNSETIKLLAYPIESAIAEKLQAMVALGDANSRMKDFYDVWICSKHLDFNKSTLIEAIAATFENRATVIPEGEFEALTTDFVAQHDIQWRAFARKIGEQELADVFGKIVEDLRAFVLPMLRSLNRGESAAQYWKGGSGWKGR
jgi:hypothetical protein